MQETITAEACEHTYYLHYTLLYFAVYIISEEISLFTYQVDCIVIHNFACLIYELVFYQKYRGLLNSTLNYLGHSLIDSSGVRQHSGPLSDFRSERISGGDQQEDQRSGGPTHM